MQTPLYIEDLIEKLYAKVVNCEIRVQHQDIGPLSSFHSAINDSKLLTRKQGMFILQLLKKYKGTFTDISIEPLLVTPVWKNEFRVIDTTKHLFLDEDGEGHTHLNIKFPYSFKDVFAKEFFTDGKDPSRWDPNTLARRVKVSKVNLVYLVEQAQRHGFTIDDSVMDAVAYVEELWSREHDLLPYSVIEDGEVHLVNGNEYADAYWKTNKRDELYHDLFLAKQMGYLLKGTVIDNNIKQLASTNETEFWIKKTENFYGLVDKLNVWPVVIILDRQPDPSAWVRKFVDEFNFSNFKKEDVRVCFRPANTEKGGPEFNEWIKENGLNKPVADGKIFICQVKPQKWMFDKEFQIKLLASNSIYPSTNNITSALMSSHPTMIYFDEIKPATKGKTSIVSL
jgi:hypothetical protein